MIATGRVTAREYTEWMARATVLVQLRMGSSPLLARITERSRRELDIVPGRELWVQIKGVALLG